MNNFDLRDHALRVLLILAGSVAAALFVLKGQAQALPGLAVGGTLGAFLMRAGAGASEE